MLTLTRHVTYVKNQDDADPRHDQGGITYSDEVLQHYINHDDDLNYPDTDWWMHEQLQEKLSTACP